VKLFHESITLMLFVVLHLIGLFLICGTARLARHLLRKSPSDGAVISPAFLTRSMTAGHDEIRDADRLITLPHSRAHEEDGVISIEISPIGVITHLVPCHLIRRQSAETSSVSMLS
jgi:hypothetical protein